MANVNLKVDGLCYCQMLLCNAAREEFGCDECFFRLFKGDFSFMLLHC